MLWAKGAHKDLEKCEIKGGDVENIKRIHSKTAAVKDLTDRNKGHHSEHSQEKTEKE